jgi:hypothetical protein
MTFVVARRIAAAPGAGGPSRGGQTGIESPSGLPTSATGAAAGVGHGIDKTVRPIPIG